MDIFYSISVHRSDFELWRRKRLMFEAERENDTAFYYLIVGRFVCKLVNYWAYLGQVNQQPQFVYFLLNFFFTISCSQKLTFASFEFFRIRNTLSNNINISK